MKKTNKDSTKITLKGVKKSDLPPYVEVNGVVYEKITNKTVTMDLDLEPKVWKTIQARIKKSHYVNEQEVIRDALRTMMEKNNI